MNALAALGQARCPVLPRRGDQASLVMRIQPDVIENGAGAGTAEPTPTDDGTVRRLADFATLGEALDYAALGQRGLNFHDARGSLERAYPFSELREEALVHARRFIALGIKPGDWVSWLSQ